MPVPLVSVVIPTLGAGPLLEECLRSLSRQTFDGFEVIVVDNSGRRAVRREAYRLPRLRVLDAGRNLGFGGAINAGVAASESALVATINDDARAHPGWLAALVQAMESHPEAGLCACQVRLAGSGCLDSAGMLISGDGSSRQRGHGEPWENYTAFEEVLVPSGSAAIYRRTMLEQTGGFDESFFLYCEDTDLGLRARRAGWRCYYVPEAIVDHSYSRSAGRASRLKAYLVERNRLRLVLRNFPAGMLVAVPVESLRRYFWHMAWMLRGRGAASEFAAQGNGAWLLGWYVARAHLSALVSLPQLIRQRRRIGATARLTAAEFGALLRQYSISPRQVAAL